MKISIEQANKLFEQLQVDAAVVADEQQADESIDANMLLQVLNTHFSTTLRPQIEQQLKPTLESGFTGRYNGALRAAASRLFGISKKEMEDLSLEQILTKCKEAALGNLEQTDAETRAIIETAIQGYEQQLEELKTSYEEQLNTQREKYLQKDITTRCLSIIQQLPRKGGDLQEQAEMLRHKMQNSFELRYNEATQRLELYKEGKPAVAENNQPVSDEDFARMWAAKAGILVNDTRHISPADVKAGQQGAYASGVIQTNDTSASTMDAIVAWVEG